jgi:hypothetical protein
MVEEKVVNLNLFTAFLKFFSGGQLGVLLILPFSHAGVRPLVPQMVFQPVNSGFRSFLYSGNPLPLPQV